MKFIFNRTNFFLVFSLTIMFVLSVILTLKQAVGYQLQYLDTIWNYLFAAKISLGLIPYYDFDLLQTPFSFYITAGFLILFGNNYLTYTVMSGLFVCLSYYLFYRIFYQFTKNRSAAVNWLLVLFNLEIVFAISTYNYNNLAIIIIACILLTEYRDRLALKNNLLIGFLFGLLFLTKQNLFFSTIFVSVVNILLTKIDYKTKINLLLSRGMACLMIILSYLFYLWCNNALYAFIDHVFLGLLDFSEKNAVSHPLLEPLFFFLYSIPLVVLLIAIKDIIKGRRTSLNDKLFITTCYAIGGIAMVYPMFDINHITKASLLVFLLVPYIREKRKALIRPIFIQILFLLLYVFIPIGYFNFEINRPMSSNLVTVNNLNHYNYVLSRENDINDVKIVESYLKQQKKLDNQVIIADSRAMFYLSLLDIYNDPFDLLIHGNMGYKGEEKKLEKIKSSSSGTYFLVGNANRTQELIDLKKYILCHYDYVETIGHSLQFYVLRKPEQLKEKKCNFYLTNDPVSGYTKFSKLE